MWAGTGTCKHSPVRNQPRERGMGPVSSRLFTGRGVAGWGCGAGSEEPPAPCTSNPRSAACPDPAPAQRGRSLPLLGQDLAGGEPGHSSCEEAQLGLVSSRPWLQGEHARMWMSAGSGCGALRASSGSQAGQLCPGVLEGAKEALILITAGLGKERAFPLTLGVGKS